MKEIKLTQSQVVLVDDEDYERLSRWKWYALWNAGTGSFYAVRKSHRCESYPIQTMLYMHNLILGEADGEVDHRDHDTLNCQKENLRHCTHSQNMANTRLRRDNTSGAKGVSWHQSARKFQVRIMVNGRRRSLGLFGSVEEAARVYRKHAIGHFGDFALDFETSTYFKGEM